MLLFVRYFVIVLNSIIYAKNGKLFKFIKASAKTQFEWCILLLYNKSIFISRFHTLNLANFTFEKILSLKLSRELSKNSDQKLFICR